MEVENQRKHCSQSSSSSGEQDTQHHHRQPASQPTMLTEAAWSRHTLAQTEGGGILLTALTGSQGQNQALKDLVASSAVLIANTYCRHQTAENPR